MVMVKWGYRDVNSKLSQLPHHLQASPQLPGRSASLPPSLQIASCSRISTSTIQPPSIHRIATAPTHTTMPAQQTTEFKKATEESRKLKQKPTDNELLEVRYHISTCNVDGTLTWT